MNAVAIVVAAIVLASAIYLRPIPQTPNYSVELSNVGFIRLNNTTGEIIACSAGPCIMRVRAGDYEP